MANSSLDFKKLGIVFNDIEREEVQNETIVISNLDAKTQERIVRQVNEEYDASYRFNDAKRIENLRRLKLYNNQKRNPSDIGDPLMFTVFNTVLASLYEDRLMVNFEGRGGEGDEDIEDNLNALALFDYDVMGKNELDYDWLFDSCFFGRGLVFMNEFDRSPGVMAPVPEVIDAVGFIRDPLATSVNGNKRGAGAMRFGGWEVGATYYELRDMPGYFNIGALRKGNDLNSLTNTLKQARDEAQNRTTFAPAEENLSKYGNYQFQLLNWLTTFKGEKYLVTLGNERTAIVRLMKLRSQKRWPIIDRALYPIAHDWDGVSIPDLTEDKQRARAKLLNIGLTSATIDAMPQYLFDQDRITNKNDLNFRINKFIGVKGRVDNAIVPVQKSNAHQFVTGIMDSLDQAAQRATATPEIQQGVPTGQSRTLGELNLVSSKVDTRYSMSAKILGWSEKQFWAHWYMMYKWNFKDKIDEKIIRIQGSLAPTFRPLTRENIISEDADPDIRIESKTVSEQKRLKEQQSFDSMAALLIQNPDNDRRTIEMKMARLRGMTKEEIDLVFPPTIDEIQAGDENVKLNDNSLPTINVHDNHRVHIQIHAKANRTPAAIAHTRAHKALMLEKRNNPQLFPPQQQVPINTTGSQPASPPPNSPTFAPVPTVPLQ